MKKNKKIFIIVFAIVLMIAGAGVLTATYADYRSSRNKEEELLSQFEKLVLENREEEEKVPEVVVISEENIEQLHEELVEEQLIDNSNADVTSNIPEGATPAPTQPAFNIYDGYTILAKLEIPSIGQADIVLEGTDLSTLKVGLGHFSDTVNAGEAGNYCICGHRGGRLGTYFLYLSNVKIGDSINVTDLSGNVFTYTVYDSFIIEPDDWKPLEQPTDGSKIITLITCTPGGQQRQVVQGRMVE